MIIYKFHLKYLHLADKPHRSICYFLCKKQSALAVYIEKILYKKEKKTMQTKLIVFKDYQNREYLKLTAEDNIDMEKAL